MSTLAVDSGIYSTDTSEIDIDVKIVVDSTEMDNKADSDGDIASSGCTGRNESHTDYLQVPSSIDTLGNTQHRGSLASIVVDVFTPENITTVLKLRLATTITVIICIMLLLFVTPIVWYNVDRPTLELTTIEYESMVRNKCNVSTFLRVPLSHVYRTVHSFVCCRYRCMQPPLFPYFFSL